MAKVRKEGATRRSRPATSPEARENQLIDLAIDVAEEQLRNGTASTQVITHFLKLGSTKEALEKEMLAKRSHLLSVQADSLESTKRIEELYENALQAMRLYGGNSYD